MTNMSIESISCLLKKFIQTSSKYTNISPSEISMLTPDNMKIIIDNDMLDIDGMGPILRLNGNVPERQKLCEVLFMYIMDNYTDELYDKYKPFYTCILPFIIKNENLLEKNNVSSERINNIIGNRSYWSCGYSFMPFIKKYKLRKGVDLYIEHIRDHREYDNEDYYENLTYFYKNNLLTSDEYRDLYREIDMHFNKKLLARLNDIEDDIDKIMKHLNL